MRASVIRVTGRSLLAGRKLRTPEIKFSKPPSLKRSVICTVHQYAGYFATSNKTYSIAKHAEAFE